MVSRLSALLLAQGGAAGSEVDPGKVRSSDRTHATGAMGQAFKVEEYAGDDLPEREGDDGQVIASQPQSGSTQNEPEEGCDAPGGN